MIYLMLFTFYDAYKFFEFRIFDLFVRTIIRAVLKFAHLGVREK